MLIDASVKYLERLSPPPCDGSSLDDDRVFYDAHRDELRDDRKLKSVWDAHFCVPKGNVDFLAG